MTFPIPRLDCLNSALGLWSVCGGGQACDIGNPVEVLGNARVDAIFALLGALLSPADDAREEPGVFVL